MHFYPLWQHISRITVKTTEIYIGHAEYDIIRKILYNALNFGHLLEEAPEDVV